MKNLLLIFSLLLLPSPLWATRAPLPTIDYAAMFFQVKVTRANAITQYAALSGSCTTGRIGYDIAAGVFKGCVEGTWAALAGGGGATANATTGTIPYLSAANVFSDSQLVRTSSSLMTITGDLTTTGTTSVHTFTVTTGGAAITGNMNASEVRSTGFYFGFGTAGSRGWLHSPADGQITLFNSATTGFSRLNFGGVTTSFPAIARNGTDFNLVLGDGTGTAGLTTGALTIGGGTAITKHLSATATLDFANQAVAGCEELTITVTGAVVGDVAIPGVPTASNTTNGIFSARVSAADTVSVKHCAVVSGNPASGVFRVDVWQHP